MRKEIKVVLTISFIISGMLFINTKEIKATIRNRIRNFFIQFTGCFGTGVNGRRNTSLDKLNSNQRTLINSNKNIDPSSNVLISLHLKSKIDDFIKKNMIVGENVENFDMSGMGTLNFNYYYYQEKSDTKPVNLVSLFKPEIIEVKKDGTGIKTMFIDNSEEIKIVTTSGFPLWVKGEDIIKYDNDESKKRVENYFKSIKGLELNNYYGVDPEIKSLISLEETELNQEYLTSDTESIDSFKTMTSNYNSGSEKYKINQHLIEGLSLNNIVSIDGNEDKILIKNLGVSSSLEFKRKELLKMPVIGNKVELIDVTKFKNIEKDNYYHQHKLGSNTLSLVSKVMPKVIGTNDNDKETKIETVFMGSSEEIKTITTLGIPLWHKGSEIINKID